MFANRKVDCLLAVLRGADKLEALFVSTSSARAARTTGSSSATRTRIRNTDAPLGPAQCGEGAKPGKIVVTLDNPRRPKRVTIHPRNAVPACPGIGDRLELAKTER